MKRITRTGLLVLAVLIVVDLIPAFVAAEELELFDPFALDAMNVVMGSSRAKLSSSGSIAGRDVTNTDTVVLRTPKLVIPQRPKLRSPFRPDHPDAWL